MQVHAYTCLPRLLHFLSLPSLFLPGYSPLTPLHLFGVLALDIATYSLLCLSTFKPRPSFSSLSIMPACNWYAYLRSCLVCYA